MAPSPAKKTAAARVRQAEAGAAAAEAARDTTMLVLRNPAPGQAGIITNQVFDALHAPVEADYAELAEAETALARSLEGHYARVGDEAYAVIREALTASGDMQPSASCASASNRSPPPAAPRHSEIGRLAGQRLAPRARPVFRGIL